jgi:hypothetical protein
MKLQSLQWYASMILLNTISLMNNIPATETELWGWIIPLFGRTQYFLGAVVLTLKHTFWSVGLWSFIVDETTSVNGPTEV